MVRNLLALSAVSALLLVFSGSAFADGAKKPEDPFGTTAPQLAEMLFKKFDPHNRGYLNRAEFKKADAALVSAIIDMARQGTLPVKPDHKDGGNGNANGNAPTKIAGDTPGSFKPGWASADTDADGKVTQSEFTNYVTGALHEANRELLDAAAAKRQTNTTNQNNNHGNSNGGNNNASQNTRPPQNSTPPRLSK